MKPAILFDLGNTLAAYYRPEDFRPILEDAITNVAEELQLRGLLRVTMESAIAAALVENREAGDFRFIPMAQRFERIFNVPLASDFLLVDALCSRFLQPIFGIGHVYDDALPVLYELRAVGCPTAIVSNAPWGSPPRLWKQELQRLGLATAVDAVVLCGEIGWRKPAREIFQYAASALGRPCSGCIFVGDDLRWDIAGSQAVGMRPILIDRDEHCLGYEGERIRELKEVLARVDASA